MGTLTSVAFAAATNIRFRSFHCNLGKKIKTPMPKVTSPLRERYCFSSPEETRVFKAVKCLGNDPNGSRGIDGGENRDTKSSVIRDSTVETASREEEDDAADEKSNSSSINEFGSDKTPYVSSRVHSLVSDFTFPFCPYFNCKTVQII